MSYIARRNEIRPASGEAPFSLDEVFFSRTDSRGVILAGNYIFRRVANYDWADMLGAPHKIIRHPDMPRAVFWLLWDRIKRGEPIAAYVKNRARDGLEYWVFAVVAPAGDGYISARIKPSSPLLAMIKAEYAALRAAEHENGLAPEESANRLLARLQALGYPDYEQFAAHALSTELISRDHGLLLPDDARISGFRAILLAADRLKKETAALSDEFHAMRTIPHNMQVIASRLEPTGGPVSTLSKNYGAISREMSDWFARNVVSTGSTCATLHGAVNTSMFLEGIARILHECEVQLNAERRTLGEINLEGDRRILSQQVANYVNKSRQGIAQVRDEADRIRRACDTMQRHVLGLSTTRVLCKIESGRTASTGDALSDIIIQLGTFQERITARLQRIAAESQEILTFSR